MDQGSTLRGWVGGLILCVLMTTSAFGQSTLPLPPLCHGLDVFQPFTPLRDRDYWTIGLGQLQRRIDQNLRRMECAQLMILREPTLKRRLPYEQARQQASETVQQAIGALQFLATPEEEPLLSTLRRAYHAYHRLNAETASLALLAETPAEVESAKALSSDKANAAFDTVLAAWQPYRTQLIPERLDDGWETASLASVGMDAATIEAMTERLRMHIDSFLIVRHGKLVYERYFHGFQQEEAHRVHSVTKSIGSLLTGVAIFHGFLPSEHISAHTFFPDAIQGPAHIRHWEALTLKHLLTMTAGLGCGGTKDGVHTNADDLACLRAMVGTPDWLQFVLDRPVASPPGRQFTYDSSSLMALSSVLTQACGMSMAELAKRYLYEPMGITASRWGQSSKGLIELAASHWLRPRDMAKLGELVLRGGLWKGKLLLSKAWVTTSTSPQVPLRNQESYGYLWWLDTFKGRDTDIPTIQARGYGGQFIFVVPTFDMVVVFTGSQYSDTGGDLSSLSTRLMQHDIINIFDALR